MWRSHPRFPLSMHGAPGTMNPLLARKSVSFSDSGFPCTEARVIKGQRENTGTLQPTLTQLFIQVLHHLTSHDLQIVHFLLPLQFFSKP